MPVTQVSEVCYNDDYGNDNSHNHFFIALSFDSYLVANKQFSSCLEDYLLRS